jgi:hypothetical protein
MCSIYVRACHLFLSSHDFATEVEIAGKRCTYCTIAQEQKERDRIDAHDAWISPSRGGA